MEGAREYGARNAARGLCTRAWGNIRMRINVCERTACAMRCVCPCVLAQHALAVAMRDTGFVS